MKTLLYVLVFGLGMMATAQVSPSSDQVSDSTPKEEPIGVFAMDEAPVFQGCENLDKKNTSDCLQQKIIEHFRKNMFYPEEAIAEKIQGRVIVSFVIDKTGSIKDIFARGPHPLLENEAKRLVMRIPAMKPGRHHGEEVDCKMTMPIVFKL